MNRPPRLQHFASDNCSGMCPEALESMTKANAGYDSSYGNDRWTEEACGLFRELFESDCEVFLVSSGTAGNSLALASLCKSYHSIVCHRFAHVETDECGAVEFFSHGARLLLAGGKDGKLDPESLRQAVTRRTSIHYPKAKAVSLTQATELGTVYTPEELQRIRGVCRDHSLKFHMDGARLANAVAALGVTPRAMTVDCGVDVLVFGGAKNGLPMGEAVVFFNQEDAEEFGYRCKQAGQLLAKMRFLAAPWVGVLKDGAWLRHARHANDCAAVLEERLRAVPEVRIMVPRQTNAVFVKLPDRAIDSLRKKGWHFASFTGPGEVRLMCSWDTTQESIEAFVRDLKGCLASEGG